MKFTYIRRYIFVIAALFVANSLFAQETEQPIYKKFPTIPPFALMKVPDSSSFKKEDLRSKRATMIIVFSPDCDHCQHATKDLQQNIAAFKKVQIVMASNQPYAMINNFYKEYEIAKYPNIMMGYDPGYFLGTFFGVRNFPSIYLYDKKGEFVQSFEGSVAFSKIAEAL